MNFSVIIVDLGNTNTSFALAREGRLSRISRVDTHGQSRRVVSDALARLVRGRRISGAVLCSVVPAMNRLWLRELGAVAGRRPLQVHHRLNLGVDIAWPKPERIGADRLANACAVAHRYGTPAIVADFGTALTFDVVSKENAYIGGVIAPGLPLMTDYLAERTALLPRLSLNNHRQFFQRAMARKRGALDAGQDANRMPAVGKSTVDAMLIGARIGYLGMVREIITCLRKDLKSRRVRLCATGGYAKWVLAGSDLRMQIDPDLTLYGINRIYELNQQ